ncbi:MAG: VOC family protein [Anaerolineales bacterium]
MEFVESDVKEKTGSITFTRLHPGTNLGYVSLTVADLRRSIDFYERSLGFQVQDRENGTAYLGAGGDPLLNLSERPGARLLPRRTGLYHFAILTPSRQALAKSLRNLIDTGTELQGGADHLVSEAIYLTDPDGNGIEIYRDRPRADWEFENGTIKMGMEHLDYQGILAELNGDPAPWIGLEPDTRLGHMHLHVSDLDEATVFYDQVIGFDFLLSYMGTASFLSAGGYHHHIGVNTWNGVGALPPPEDSVGLRYFTVLLPGEDDLGMLVERLQRARIYYEMRDDGLFTLDPSQNGMLFVVKG